MSMSSVNPYMSMLAAYKAATADNKQSNTPLDTVESTQAKATTRPGEDAVSISEEASQKSRAEQYALQDDPIELFNEWKEEGNTGIVLARVQKPLNELLPENQALISHLTEKQKTLSSAEDRMLVAANISTVMQYGDKEIFNSESDINRKDQAVSDAAKLQVSYLVNKNGDIPRAEDVLGKSVYESSLVEVMDSGFKQTHSFEQPKATPEYMSKFDDRSFLENLLDSKKYKI